MNRNEYQTGRKDHLLIRLLRGSLLLSLLSRLADWIYSALKRSVIGSIMTSYDDLETLRKDSLINNLPVWKTISVFLTKCRLWISDQLENSWILSGIRGFLRILLDMPLRFYGIFLFTHGTYTVAISIVSQVAVNFKTPSPLDFVIGVSLMAAFLPAMFSKECLGEELRTSILGRLILIRLLGVREETLVPVKKIKGSSILPFILGTATGLATYIMSPLVVPASLAGIAALILLIEIPEDGVLAILLLLPFIPTMALVGLIFFVACCYLLKLLTGKRSFHFQLLDYLVLVFFFVELLGGVISVARSASVKSAAVYCCFIFSYFLVVGLIRTSAWCRRCIGSVIVSSVIVSLYGIYENYFGLAQKTWQDEKMFEEITGRVVSTFENPNVLAEYLIMTMPFMLALLLSKTTLPRRLTALLCCGACGLCLIFTWSRGAWLGIMFGVLLFLLMITHKTMCVMFLGLFAVPFLPFVLPQSIINRFASIGNLKDTSTNYRVNIWKAVIQMLKDHFVGGIGVGTAAFSEVYPNYSLAAIESAPHSHNLYLQILVEIGLSGLIVFLALMFILFQSGFTFTCRQKGPDERNAAIFNAACLGSVSAMLVQGMTDYVWYNYRVFCMFFLVIGITAAIRRASMNESIEAETDNVSAERGEL